MTMLVPLPQLLVAVAEIKAQNYFEIATVLSNFPNHDHDGKITAISKPKF